ncbi:DUF2513 domain-containing protein [Paracoccus nototheniae]|uniref:DUF2513 domain-containing protein n=1 Tax=Paracoccus nototheniae TaxID=2489002 RepID=A0ABW4DX15_9RHOB|nr:DUF2513 domain-containing protein [Paracoccus nototheniae]
MKYNLDLIREILLAVENYEPESVSGIQEIGINDFSGTPPQNNYHISMLIDEGFIKPTNVQSLDLSFHVHGLTMKGHQFISATEEKTVWDKTKAYFSAAGGWTVDVVLAYAKEEAIRRLTGEA